MLLRTINRTISYCQFVILIYNYGKSVHRNLMSHLLILNFDSRNYDIRQKCLPISKQGKQIAIIEWFRKTHATPKSVSQNDVARKTPISVHANRDENQKLPRISELYSNTSVILKRSQKVLPCLQNLFWLRSRSFRIYYWAKLY